MSFLTGHQTSKFAGDAFAHLGHWGTPNSRANFCEEDYVITFYLAEFINALSNFAYVGLALKYMYGTGSRGLFRPKLDFMSVALFLLGIGSFLFHASLRKTLEFVDELSMLGLTWSMLDAIFTADIKSPRKRFAVHAGFAIFHVALCGLYVWTVNIVYQVVGFIGGIVITGIKSHVLLRSLGRPGGLSDKTAGEWSRKAWTAVSWSSFGYLLWNLEFIYCDELRTIRQAVGLPWAWVFEFHGWWHVFTAVGAAKFMDVAREMRWEVQRQNGIKKME